jgi:hypothetical protein
LSGWLDFANRRRKKEAASLLGLHTMAARGEIKNVKKQIKEAERD